MLNSGEQRKNDRGGQDNPVQQDSLTRKMS